MNGFEQLGAWYLRLNGYFTIPNFIVHGSRGSLTDIDIPGVRFPYSEEIVPNSKLLPDDYARLKFRPDKVDIVLAESKAGPCNLNHWWSTDDRPYILKYVLRRIGIFKGDDRLSPAVARLCEVKYYEGESHVIRVICFGSKANENLVGATQILWSDVFTFINRRFSVFRRRKADHQHWDAFGLYLWARFEDGVPVANVEDLIAGWTALQR